MDDPATTPDDWTEGTVEANGVSHHYTRTGGDGPPLVVAHGVFDDGPCRTPLVRDLAADYDVVAYDARGHGRSDAPESGYGADERAADLVGLVEALDLADPVLFGHSMGGDTVLAAAAARPDLPRAAVAVDPACLLEEDDSADDAGDAGDAGDGDGADLAGEVREQIVWWHDHTKAELLEADDELAGHVEAGETELASLLADARLRVSTNVAEVFENGWLDPRETFPEIAAPTLVLRADVDEARRERDRELVSLIGGARLVHVEGAGHTVFRDERETATRELREFLDRV
ncbi:MAG: alpha/beta fold hydrolase [Haloarculaceae archaeon]